MIKRLKYISRFAQQLSSEQIDEIATISAENNRKMDITGALMASGGLFFQILEGPKENIDELWAKIQNDPRHKDVLLLKVEDNVEERIFPEWSMKKLNLDRSSDIKLEPLKAILQTVLRQSIMIQELTSVLERSAWAEMADAF
ncbi:MAG: BLUF domain-containing protein [Acidobacteriota bacterium]